MAIQDSSKPGKPGKWTKTGVVTDTLPFHSYEVKVDGSNFLTKRNRVHLRKIIPYVSQTMLQEQRLRSQILPTPVVTRSVSSAESAPSEPETPGLTPSPPELDTPAQSPAPTPTSQSPSPSISPTNQPSTSRAHQPSTLSPRIREQWILSNEQIPRSPSPSPPHSNLSRPPQPGERHDYAALAEQAKAMRDSIMSARKANLTT